MYYQICGKGRVVCHLAGYRDGVGSWELMMIPFNEIWMKWVVRYHDLFLDQIYVNLINVLWKFSFTNMDLPARNNVDM